MATPVFRPPHPYPPPHPIPTSAPPTVPGPHPIPLLSHIGKSGQNALWAGFVIFLVSTLLFAILGARLHVKYRIFHVLAFLITGISTLSYYAMATGSGYVYVSTGWHTIQGNETLVLRQVFWSRYVDWALTTPLTILALALLGGFVWMDVFRIIVINEAMIFTGLFATLHRGSSSARWGWYAFGCVFLLYVLFHLVWTGRKCSKHQHSSIHTFYTPLAVYIAVVWLVYPVIFALGRGTGILNPNAETIAYTVLDIFAKTVFGLVLVGGHKHDSEEAHACRLPESWTEPRGARGGAIQLPGGDD